MTVACGLLQVKPPANITATNMVLSKTLCTPPCNADVTITWTNNGGTPGSFEPAVVVNGVRTGLGSNKNVPAGGTDTETFNLIGLTVADYTICPDPN
jgi:hypothetical protein